MAEDVYRYRAFISYRHTERDRKWARWLVEKLETFRTPRALVRKGAPARIGQLFRDDDEIPASSDLSRQIEEALQASKFLIVVCSPNAPKSRWIRREIEFFRSLGRGDRIFALLVEGEPEDAFPPELLRIPQERPLADGTKTVEWIEVEPIAADVRPRRGERTRVTERRAFTRIAAGLLGVEYDQLVRREKQRAARKQRLRIAATTVLLGGVGAGGYAYWDYSTLHTRYYRDYGSRWGVPFGIAKIDSDLAAHRNVSYAVDTLHGYVIAVRRQNGSHGPMPLSGDGIDGEPWDARVAEWRLPYAADRATQIDVYGKRNDIATSSAGNKLRTENFTWQADASAVVAFKNPAGGAEALQALDSGVVGSATSDVIARSSLIAVHRFLFTSEGYIAEKLYRTVWGVVARDANGSFGRSYARNSRGQVVALQNLDSYGHALVDRRGITKVRFLYAPEGDFFSAEYRSVQGKLVPGALGYAVRRAKLDKYGNRIEDSFFGADGRPAVRNDWGVALIRLKYDERGNKVEEAYFGTDGKPVLRQDRGMARTAMKFDKRGNVVEVNYFGTDGKPILRKDYGIARLLTRYDNQGNDVEERNFGTDGKPILNSDGFAGETIRYDARGNLVEANFFGTDGKPVLRKDGIARQSWAYDERGKEIEEDYFGTDGKPILGQDDGAARLTIRYDERGNEIEHDYFGTNGRPVLTSDEGIARETFKFDDRGNGIEAAYFGTDGKPVLRRDVGVARATAEYDDRGNKVEESYFNVDGRPVLHRDTGAARIRYEYGVQGNLTTIKRYDVQDRLLPGRTTGG